MIYARLTKSTSSHQKSLIEGGMKKTFFFGYFICNQNLSSEIMDLSVFRHITIMRITQKHLIENKSEGGPPH